MEIINARSARACVTLVIISIGDFQDKIYDSNFVGILFLWLKLTLMLIFSWLFLLPQTNWWSGLPEIPLKRNLTVCEMITESPMTQTSNLWVDILSWQVYLIASQVTVFAEIKKHWAASGNLLPLFSWNMVVIIIITSYKLIRPDSVCILNHYRISKWNEPWRLKITVR